MNKIQFDLLAGDFSKVAFQNLLASCEEIQLEYGTGSASGKTADAIVALNQEVAACKEDLVSLLKATLSFIQATELTMRQTDEQIAEQLLRKEM